MGLGGMCLTLLGASVVSTDVAAVLPLLHLNSENNMAPASLRSKASPSVVTSVVTSVRPVDVW